MAKAGNVSGALDICWELLLRQDINLIGRAQVNALVSTIAEPEHHPEEFAFEALAICKELCKQLPRTKLVDSIHENAMKAICDIREEGWEYVDDEDEGLKVQGKGTSVKEESKSSESYRAIQASRRSKDNKIVGRFGSLSELEVAAIESKSRL